MTWTGLDYIASYTDLMNAFGANAATANVHYMLAGRFEGRTVSFNPAQYLANYADLQAAFGFNTEAATLHYITTGYYEGRTDDFLGGPGDDNGAVWGW